MLNQILVPVVSLGGLGLVFGSLLAYASHKFAVEVDERVEKIIEALPAANCGACGYAGCAAFAAGVVAGDVPANGCPVGGNAVASEIANIMGVTAADVSKSIARMLCNGTCEEAKDRYEYFGVSDCVAAAKLGGGQKACQYGCLGLGTCVKACQFDAITIKDGIAVINEQKCTACEKCLTACPKQVIALISEKNQTWVMCKSKDNAKEVRGVCTTGCIACKLCEKACKFDAVHVENNVATVDYKKCVNCNQCVIKCPKKIIRGKTRNEKAFIEEEACIGCTICKKQCKFDAVEGELKTKHRIINEKCVGCGVCAQKCPKKCIEIK